MAFPRKLRLLFVLTCVLAGVIWLRVVELQALQGDYWRAQARSVRELDRPLAPPRGRIVDRVGKVVAKDASIPRLAFVGEEWVRRERLQCSACGAISFYGGSRPRHRRCRCRDPEATWIPMGKGDLGPLEEVLGVPEGTLAALAAQRLGQVEVYCAQKEKSLEGNDLPPFLIRDAVARYEDQLLNFRKVLLPELALDERAMRLLELDEVGRFRGFEIHFTPRRVIEGKAVPGQLLGYVSAVQPGELKALRAKYGGDVSPDSRVGRTGIEKAYQDLLLGRHGMIKLARDEHGAFTRIVSEQPAKRGESLRLGLTLEACEKARTILEHRATSGRYHPQALPSAGFVAMEATTGRIVAWAELPVLDVSEDLARLFDSDIAAAEQAAVYDPAAEAWVLPEGKVLPKGLDLDALRAHLSKPAPIMLSRVSQLAVEPGSTFKVFIGLGMLDGLARVGPGVRLPLEQDQTSYYCRPMRGLPGCHAHGPVDFVHALEVSCNRYFALSLRFFPEYWKVYRESLPTLLSSLGFGRPTGVDVAGERAGQLLQDWVDFDPREPVAAATREVTAKGRLRVAFRPDPTLSATVAGRSPRRLQRMVQQALVRVGEVLGTRDAFVGLSRMDGMEHLRVLRIVFAFRGPSDAEARAAARRALQQALAPLRGARILPESPAIPGAETFAIRVAYHKPIGRNKGDPIRILRDDGSTFAIGQGPILVTPLQMVRAVAALANGGRLFTPRVVEGVENFRFPRRVVQLDLDPAEVAEVREGMRLVVEGPHGTARNAGFESVAARVYGKTGTSQTSGWWHRPDRSSKGPWHHWFVGFAERPGMEPLAFACVLHAREEGGAGGTAAPAVADFLRWWFEQGPEAR